MYVVYKRALTLLCRSAELCHKLHVRPLFCFEGDHVGVAQVSLAEGQWREGGGRDNRCAGDHFRFV